MLHDLPTLPSVVQTRLVTFVQNTFVAHPMTAADYESGRCCRICDKRDQLGTGNEVSCILSCEL
jgi:hypothetical protein